LRKVILDIGFDYNFVLYGIVSEERSHTLVWQINHHTGSAFSRTSDLVPGFGTNASFTLPRFEYHDELNHLSFELIANKDESEYLLPELKHIDYFILVKGALESFRRRKYTEPFRQVPAIRIISEIATQSLKQRERLIF
jgi:hypothetical protein